MSLQIDSYARELVADVIAEFRGRIDTMVQEHPELALVKDELEEVAHHDTDPLKELGCLLDACEEVFVHLNHLLNPTGLPLHMTEDGRVLTQTFRGVATFVTDIRGFTDLTQNVSRQWGVSVFTVLSYCYFPYLSEMLDRYGCHYLNYTGDGLLVLCTERQNPRGEGVLPSLDNAVLCAIDLTGVTNSIAETWKQLGLTQIDGKRHETGLGLCYGDVEVGDPFVPNKAFTGECAHFDELFRTILAQHVPYYQPSRDYRGRVRAIHALSGSINWASRLQDTDKTAPNHTCMITAQDVARLCPLLQERFEPVGSRTLKGLGEVQVYGIHRHEQVDVPALERACFAYYASRGVS